MSHSTYENNTAFKRPRLDRVNTSNAEIQENRPFSAFLFNSFRRSKKHPILSDRKLIVYNLTVERPPLPEGYEENAWVQLQEAIRAIQGGLIPKESLEVLYQLCENMCQYNLGSLLTDKLYAECETYIKQEFAKLENDNEQAMVGSEFLKSIDAWWKTYCGQLSQIRSIFLYLDRAYIAFIHGSLWNMGMKIFGKVYQQCPRVREKVVVEALDLVECERDEVDTNATLLHSVLHMLMDLNLYHTDFEPRLFDESRKYYSDEGNRLIEEMDMSEYIQHVDARLHEESVVRVKKYFDRSTKVPLNAIVEEELLKKHVEHILEKGFPYFMDNSCEDDLSMLYQLLQKVNSLDVFVEHFRDYVKKQGALILLKKRSIPDHEVIRMVLSFKRKTETIMTRSLEGDERFEDAQREGFEHFINLRESRTTRLLAAYTDYILRNYDRMDDHQLEKGLDQAIVLFRLLRGKDFFQALYKRDLSKRLLLDMKSRHAEKNMLAKLRAECGLAYTSKMEGMLRDIKHSHDLMNEFKSLPEFGVGGSFNFKASILTYGFWPSYTPVNITLPPEFADVKRRYQGFYKTKYSSRELKWQNSLSVCSVTGNYPKGTKELTLTLLQAVVVLLFNDEAKPVFTFKEILQATDLDELELRRTLKSLACEEQKLLVKSPEGEDVYDTDTFAYNEEYTSNHQRVRMNAEKLKQVIENTANVQRTVLTSREHQIDAAIVRTMKSERQLTHGALLSEVMKRIKFTITAQDVKTRVEALIVKQYLERAENDGYKYLA